MPMTHWEGSKRRTDNQREIRERSAQPHGARNSCSPSAWYLAEVGVGKVYRALQGSEPLEGC